jgi:hypothetical protein
VLRLRQENKKSKDSAKKCRNSRGGIERGAASALCAVDDSTLHKWLSGKVNISSPAKAAIFYYFELLERLNNV